MRGRQQNKNSPDHNSLEIGGIFRPKSCHVLFGGELLRKKFWAKAKGRRLADDLNIQRDSLGVPYEEIVVATTGGIDGNRQNRNREDFGGLPSGKVT